MDAWQHCALRYPLFVYDGCLGVCWHSFWNNYISICADVRYLCIWSYRVPRTWSAGSFNMDCTHSLFWRQLHVAFIVGWAGDVFCGDKYIVQVPSLQSEVILNVTLVLSSSLHSRFDLDAYTGRLVSHCIRSRFWINCAFFFKYNKYFIFYNFINV